MSCLLSNTKIQKIPQSGHQGRDLDLIKDVLGEIYIIDNRKEEDKTHGAYQGYQRNEHHSRDHLAPSDTCARLDNGKHHKKHDDAQSNVKRIGNSSDSIGKNPFQYREKEGKNAHIAYAVEYHVEGLGKVWDVLLYTQYFHRKNDGGRAQDGNEQYAALLVTEYPMPNLSQSQRYWIRCKKFTILLWKGLGIEVIAAAGDKYLHRNYQKEQHHRINILRTMPFQIISDHIAGTIQKVHYRMFKTMVRVSDTSVIAKQGAGDIQPLGAGFLAAMGTVITTKLRATVKACMRLLLRGIHRRHVLAFALLLTEVADAALTVF